MANYHKLKRINYFGDSIAVAHYARSMKDNNHPHATIGEALSTAMTIIANEPDKAIPVLLDLKETIEIKLIELRKGK